MTQVKVIAMYLPQYHEVPENSMFWGEGFTDWVCVKSAKPLFSGHREPRIPMNNNYYDLSKKKSLKWQIEIAKKYGIYGFGIYHYWFSSSRRVLTKPAEIILDNSDLDMPFFFAWDNTSWKRTWSNVPGNDWAPLIDQKQRFESGYKILLEYDLGGKVDWKIHFDYLLKFFNDKRYIKIDNKPVFIIWNYSFEIEEMHQYWNILAKQHGFAGVEIIYQHNPRLRIPKELARFIYEPAYSAWGGLFERIKKKVNQIIGKNETLNIYDYDTVWQKILERAKYNRDKNCLYGGFVGYDDTPRRGLRGNVILGATPEKFSKYMLSLLEICNKNDKKFIFLTAWNEWGEGAYLEPDVEFHYEYLEALKYALEMHEEV